MTNRVQINRCKMILTNIIAFRNEDPDEFYRQVDMLQDVIYTFNDVEACFNLLDENDVPDIPIVENELYERISFLIMQLKAAIYKVDYAVQNEMF